MALPYGWIARHSRAEIRGFRVPHSEPASGLGSASPPVGVIDRVNVDFRRLPAHVPFGSSVTVAFTR